MLDQNERHSGVGWEPAEQPSECLQSASGGTNADNRKFGAGLRLLGMERGMKRQVF